MWCSLKHKGIAQSAVSRVRPDGATLVRQLNIERFGSVAWRYGQRQTGRVRIRVPRGRGEFDLVGGGLLPGIRLEERGSRRVNADFVFPPHEAFIVLQSRHLVSPVHVDVGERRTARLWINRLKRDRPPRAPGCPGRSPCPIRGPCRAATARIRRRKRRGVRLPRDGVSYKEIAPSARPSLSLELGTSRGSRGNQNASSSGIWSPPARVPRYDSTIRSIVSSRKRTEPSANAKLAPPAWWLPKPWP